MDEIYAAFHLSGGDFNDKALMSPDNLMMISDMYSTSYHNNLIHIPDQDHHGVYSLLGVSHNNNDTIARGFQSSGTSEAALITRQIQRGSLGNSNEVEDEGYPLIKAQIASHPSYPKLLNAYIDCRKVGAPAEVASVLDEIRHENFCKRSIATLPFGVDPELDEFMETYCEILRKYKAEMSRPFDEATSFLSKIEAQLGNLCKGTTNLSYNTIFTL
ncbi:hypothetical protein Leryth_002281 [Lithospermum erythrorhizon]|uniref:Homeodomain transcription factor n=1 Tax=Lithospermum erythrorhizon TaxID=34254 RepID=A0AAV3QUP1_LITER|nr:hypothetical protein Leryth_002281 [Lithospermum erythrorhizon]